MIQKNNLFINRLTYGVSSKETSINVLDLSAWLDNQLHPNPSEDAELLKRLKNIKLRIKYTDPKNGPEIDEMRSLRWLDSPIDGLWKLNDPASLASNQEKVRPRLEVTAAALLRAVYSQWQLQEVICDFWHNHFNVNAADHNVSISLPVYDREVIRRHCFGNFKEMLESVATSPAMLWYLNNRSSKAGAPNENFAREFFELHTLGRDAYLNGYYNHWQDVPGAKEGKPKGYIDQDVYEAARAFTGWTVEDGSGLGGGQNLPRTGKFTYVESWHDNYQKRILAVDIDPYQPSMADGRKVINLAALHSATAQFLCKKLCIRLVSDNPSNALINSASKVWQDNQEQSDQIARVIKHIVLSNEFGQSSNNKLKRPLELVASYLRATGIEFTPTEGLFYEMENAGQRLFTWPTPTGHPDQSDQWAGPNNMRRRWTLIAGLTDNWWATGNFNPFELWGEKKVIIDDFVTTWLKRLYGEAPKELSDYLVNMSKLQSGAQFNNPSLAKHIVAWAAMAPQYQLR